VVFDPASGDTHLITAKAAFVLQLLEKGPLTRDGLLSEIRGNGQFGAEAENLDAELDSYLLSFRNLGLIRVSRR
jgi:PqqD family protein of HPr-rel-A system